MRVQGQAEQLSSLQDAQRAAKLQMDQHIRDLQVRPWQGQSSLPASQCTAAAAAVAAGCAGCLIACHMHLPEFWQDSC